MKDIRDVVVLSVVLLSLIIALTSLIVTGNFNLATINTNVFLFGTMIPITILSKTNNKFNQWLNKTL